MIDLGDGERIVEASTIFYRREWPKLLCTFVALTRHTFGLPWPATLRGAWLVLRANRS